MSNDSCVRLQDRDEAVQGRAIPLATSRTRQLNAVSSLGPATLRTFLASSSGHTNVRNGANHESCAVGPSSFVFRKRFCHFVYLDAKR